MNILIIFQNDTAYYFLHKCKLRATLLTEEPPLDKTEYLCKQFLRFRFSRKFQTRNKINDN